MLNPRVEIHTERGISNDVLAVPIGQDVPDKRGRQGRGRQSRPWLELMFARVRVLATEDDGKFKGAAVDAFAVFRR